MLLGLTSAWRQAVQSENEKVSRTLGTCPIWQVKPCCFILFHCKIVVSSRFWEAGSWRNREQLRALCNTLSADMQEDAVAGAVRFGFLQYLYCCYTLLKAQQT